ncbi:MAG TPA: carbon storage regulator, partial [Campylobacterales bacterium]|nr:carbon storage regulator [Campylobacterales bacterium]
MLVLSRKLKEEIYLGNDVSIKVVEITKNGIKLGIDAPKDMIILRGELKKRIEDSNKKAINNSELKQVKDLSR